MKQQKRTRRKRQEWDIGSVFAVKQLDGLFTVGQVLDRPMRHWVSCAFYDIRLPSALPLTVPLELPFERVISTRIVDREALDFSEWPVIGQQEIALAQDHWPHESTRSSGWVGARMTTYSLAEDFLNAFYALTPWDEPWADADYLDSHLFRADRKPSNLIYSKKQPG